MKELSSHITEEIELRVEHQQKKRIDYIGTFKRYPGHTIWKINLRTQEISVAEFDEEVIDFETKMPKKKIITKPEHWYCSALNEQSAFKKFNNMAKTIMEKQKSNLQ